MGGVTMATGRAKGRAGKPPEVILTPYGQERKRKRAKWIVRELDYELDKLKGAKRFGLDWLSLATLVFALGLVPAFMVWRTPEIGPIGTPNLVAAASRELSVAYRPLPIEGIDPDLQRALVVANDPNFCFDGAVLRRLTAENAFLWAEPDGATPSPVRGVMADYLGALINLFWDKPKTLTIFANTANWGGGLIGVEAAAQARLGTSATDLDSVNAALPLVIGRANPDLLRNAAQSVTLRQLVGGMANQMAKLEADQAFHCLAPADPVTPSASPPSRGRGSTSRP